VVLKLNGGLGTSMGMTRAKSLVEVKNGLTFLDLIARQVLHLRGAYDCRLPLVLMNSFRTREDSLAHLSRYPELASDVPPDFLQHKVPKVLAADLSPARWPADPEHEWCPPGHGDIYTALLTSGTLAALLEAGYRWAFVSNADNLGAVPDPAILGWIADEAIPFLMEVCPRTEAHKKGGHLARRRTSWTSSRTSPCTASSTPTTCGSTCGRSTSPWARATACSICP
jgi:UTP--glucose-1-phosphate uridylyltransferase